MMFQGMSSRSSTLRMLRMKNSRVDDSRIAVLSMVFRAGTQFFRGDQQDDGQGDDQGQNLLAVPATQLDVHPFGLLLEAGDDRLFRLAEYQYHSPDEEDHQPAIGAI